MIAHHVCIQTNQYEQSKAFYTRLMGFTVVSETPNFHGRAYNTWLRDEGGLMIELQTPKEGKTFTPAEKEAEGIAHLCFVVEDVSAFARRLMAAGWTSFRRKGGEVVYQVLGSKLCKVVAPEGTIIELRDTAEL